MKNICFTFLLSILCLNAFAQQEDTLIGKRIWLTPLLPTVNKQVVYTDTITMTGVSKKTMTDNIVDWQKYNLDNSMKKLSQLENGANKIIGTGKINYKQGVVTNAQQYIVFDYEFIINDGWYSYKIDRITGKSGKETFSYSEMYQEDKRPVKGKEKWTNKYRYELLSDLHSYITLLFINIRKTIIKN